jgi:hypothetical protein
VYLTRVVFLFGDTDKISAERKFLANLVDFSYAENSFKTSSGCAEIFLCITIFGQGLAGSGCSSTTVSPEASRAIRFSGEAAKARFPKIEDKPAAQNAIATVKLLASVVMTQL